MTFVDKLITSLENNEYIIGIFFENSKAFDIADHSLLLCKISPYGITDNALGLSEQCIMFTLMYSYVCVLYCFASHEKLNHRGHSELRVTPWAHCDHGDYGSGAQWSRLSHG